MRYKLVLSRRSSSERGFTLLASGVCSVALIAAAGLAVDIGRMYITKNEAQSYSDAAAVSAALKLNGTAYGLTQADAAVAASPNSWNFGTTAFGGTVTEYSANGLTGWQTSATANPATVAYARVTATVNNLTLYLLPVLNAFGGNIANITTVKALAVAGQVLRPPTVFPYSPIAHAVNCNSPVAPAIPGLPAGMNLGVACDATNNFGYEIGRQYDIRWPTGPVVGLLGDKQVPCDGDNQQQWINELKGLTGSPIYGGIDLSALTLSNVGSSTIQTQSQDDGRTTGLVIGSQLSTKNGADATIVSDFNARAGNDDPTPVAFQTPLSDTYGAGSGLASPDGKVDIHDNPNYHTYETGPQYTGRRIITVIVRSGGGLVGPAPVDLPLLQQNVDVGFAQFLLAPSYNTSGGGNNPWCGTYIGNSPLYGTNSGGVGNGGLGVSYVRLTQ